MLAGSATSSRVNSTPVATACASVHSSCAPAGAPDTTTFFNVRFCSSRILVRYSSQRHARRRAPISTAAVSLASRPLAPASRAISVSPLVRYFAVSAAPARSSAAWRPSLSFFPAPASASRTTLPSMSANPSNTWPALPVKREALAPSPIAAGRSPGRLS